MKYRHAFHAGNFADVHKHVALLALLRLLTRKDKGLLLLDTHAGRGLYDLGAAAARKAGEAEDGIGRLTGLSAAAATAAQAAAATALPAEIVDYLETVRAITQGSGLRNAYPGSPLIALATLRRQDRAVFIETQIEEHIALREAVRNFVRSTAHRDGPSADRVTIECADGYSRLGNWLPPLERRALVLIDPPYEDSSGDFQAVVTAAQECLRRLANAVIAIWYPIKLGKETDAWRKRLQAALPALAGGAPTPTCALELWVHPRDTRVGLNGSGMLVINPPWQFAERADEWLPSLHRKLDPEGRGGWSIS